MYDRVICNMVSKKVEKRQGTSHWLVIVALVLIVVLILAILYQLAYPSKVLDAFETLEAFAQPIGADLTYVYMDGCGYCKKFDPIWVEFTTTYRKELQTAGVNTRKLRNDDSATADYGLHGYPAVLLVSRSGDFAQTTFEGQRTVQGLAGFVSNTYPAFNRS